MNVLGILTFVAGLVLAVVAAYGKSNWLPWLVAGLGILTGILSISLTGKQEFLLVGIALMVALISIEAQHYNPKWLTSIVLYVKVFFAHMLLIVSLLAVLNLIFG